MAYIYCADIYCADCASAIMRELPKPEGKEGLDYDSDDYPCGPYPDGGGEADSPQHCAECGEALENPLTSDGVDHLREMLEETTERALRFAATGDPGYSQEDLQHRARLAIMYRELYKEDLRYG